MGGVKEGYFEGDEGGCSGCSEGDEEGYSEGDV